MRDTRRLQVRSAVLRWARTSAGISIEDAAKRVGIRPEVLVEWESQDPEPTINQLRKAAEIYDRPLAALLMTEPPDEQQSFELPDFRAPAVRGKEGIGLNRAILRIRRQQEAIQEIAEDDLEIEIPALDFIEFLPDLNVEEAAKRLRSELELDELPVRLFSQPEELLRRLVRALEGRGYLIVQIQRIPIDEMRGFSIADGVVPVIALNGADSPRGKIYTLLHELVHIGLRASGLCDLARQHDSPLERYCDSVAAATLMPRKLFRTVASNAKPTDYEDLRTLSERFGASAESALIRMIGLGLATWDDYNLMRPEFRAAYQRFKSDADAASKGRDAPIFYILRARDLGRPYIQVVLSAHQNGSVSARDVTGMLGVTYDKIPKLAAASGATQ